MPDDNAKKETRRVTVRASSDLIDRVDDWRKTVSLVEISLSDACALLIERGLHEITRRKK